MTDKTIFLIYRSAAQTGYPALYPVAGGAVPGPCGPWMPAGTAAYGAHGSGPTLPLDVPVDVSTSERPTRHHGWVLSGASEGPRFHRFIPILIRCCVMFSEPYNWLMMVSSIWLWYIFCWVSSYIFWADPRCVWRLGWTCGTPFAVPHPEHIFSAYLGTFWWSNC